MTFSSLISQEPLANKLFQDIEGGNSFEDAFKIFITDFRSIVIHGTLMPNLLPDIIIELEVRFKKGLEALTLLKEDDVDLNALDCKDVEKIIFYLDKHSNKGLETLALFKEFGFDFTKFTSSQVGSIVSYIETYAHKGLEAVAFFKESGFDFTQHTLSQVEGIVTEMAQHAHKGLEALKFLKEANVDFSKLNDTDCEINKIEEHGQNQEENPAIALHEADDISLIGETGDIVN